MKRKKLVLRMLFVFIETPNSKLFLFQLITFIRNGSGGGSGVFFWSWCGWNLKKKLPEFPEIWCTFYTKTDFPLKIKC